MSLAMPMMSSAINSSDSIRSSRTLPGKSARKRGWGASRIGRIATGRPQRRQVMNGLVERLRRISRTIWRLNTHLVVRRGARRSWLASSGATPTRISTTRVAAKVLGLAAVPLLVTRTRSPVQVARNEEGSKSQLLCRQAARQWNDRRAALPVRGVRLRKMGLR